MTPVAIGAPGPAPPMSMNNLINGKMDVDCQSVITNGANCVPNAGLSKFQFQVRIVPASYWNQSLIHSLNRAARPID